MHSKIIDVMPISFEASTVQHVLQQVIQKSDFVKNYITIFELGKFRKNDLWNRKISAKNVARKIAFTPSTMLLATQIHEGYRIVQDHQCFDT